MADKPTEWKPVLLDQVLKIDHGWPFKSELFSTTGTDRPIVVSIGNFDYTGGFRFDSTQNKYYNGEYPKEYELSPGTILLVMTCQTPGGEILGLPGKIPDDGKLYLHNQRLGKVIVREPGLLLPEFFYYVALGQAFNRQLCATASGTKILHTSPSRIEACEILLPPLAEQKAIAAILAALDDKIELNRRMNANLEAMARALYQSWFVDFDPVRAKLDGLSPVGLDPAVAQLFPAAFEDPDLEHLPAGWARHKIRTVCSINSSTLVKNDPFETLEYIEISEVHRGEIANVEKYTRGNEPSRARRRLNHGDTVLSTVRPDRGAHFLALNPPENRVASTGFAVLTPKTVPWSYLYAAMTQREVSEHLGRIADGGAYPAIRPEVIGNMEVTIPCDTGVLEAFDKTCAPLFELADSNRAQSRHLAELRDLLLPRLLSGELTVSGLLPK